MYIRHFILKNVKECLKLKQVFRHWLHYLELNTFVHEKIYNITQKTQLYYFAVVPRRNVIDSPAFKLASFSMLLFEKGRKKYSPLFT